MAVYTHITAAQLETFLQDYDLGELQNLAPIIAGVSNTNYQVTTTQGIFILTLFEHYTPADALPFFMELMTHLALNGITCPLPYKGKDGTVIRQLNGRPAVLINFLQGKSVTEPSTEQCRSGGAMLGKMHRIGASFALQRDNSYGLQAWHKMAANACKPENNNVASAELQKIIIEELAFLDKEMPANLPRGAIHGDYFLDNVFFQNNTDVISGVIDFYYACTDFLSYDLALAINAWCWNKKSAAFDQKLWRAFYEGYCSERILSDEENAALPIMLRASALWIILLRLDVMLNSSKDSLLKPHDPISWVNRLQSLRALHGKLPC